MTRVNDKVEKKEITVNNCENCKFRMKYDKNPRSMLGRVWKWHTGWCPGWKSYLKSLPDDERVQVTEKYSFK